jgi:hypothetical protein
MGIDAVQFTAPKQAVDNSRPLCPGMGTCKEIVFAAKGYGPDRVINLSAGVTTRTRLQNRTCPFQDIRLLNDVVLVMHTSLLHLS